MVEGSSSGGGPSWLGLLRWSVQHNDGTQPPNLSAASSRDREWLRAALEESVRDDNVRMKEIISRLAELADGPPAPHREDMVSLLEEAHDICEQVDNAAAFIRFGGGRLMLALAGRATEPPAARCEALAVLGACAQNNPRAQQLLWQGGVVEDLKVILTQAVGNRLRLRALGALSCAVRGHRAAEDAFLAPCVPPEIGGVQLLEGVLQAGPPAAHAKVFFFVRALIDTDGTEQARAALLWPLMGSAVEATTHQHMEVRESAMRLLLACATAPAAPHGGDGGARGQLLSNYGPILQAAALARRLAMEHGLGAALDMDVDMGSEAEGDETAAGAGESACAAAAAGAASADEGEMEDIAQNWMTEVTLWQDLSAALGVDLGFGINPNAPALPGQQPAAPEAGEDQPEEAEDELEDAAQQMEDAAQEPVLLIAAPPPRPSHIAEAP